MILFKRRKKSDIPLAFIQKRAKLLSTGKSLNLSPTGHTVHVVTSVRPRYGCVQHCNLACGA